MQQIKGTGLEIDSSEIEDKKAKQKWEKFINNYAL
jgi:hypothetical protein